ncbi:insulinase family protein, partial [Rhizobium laguerreae]
MFYKSDLQADPDVHFGTLANGMRFAIMRNVTPPGQVSVHFRIGSGSLDENDNQQGLAHVLEHMAFKGSTHVAEGEMIRILQRKGLAFGPDINAYTSYDETVYFLNLPEADADTVSTGLMLMRETASELTLDAGAFDRERGVILSEERLRDTPQYRAALEIMNSLLAGKR